jgi:hypothetical protein
MRRNSRGITDNNNNINSNNSNNANCDNDTVFGSTFSNINMKINVDLSEYKEKMKRYYDSTHC